MISQRRWVLGAAALLTVAAALVYAYLRSPGRAAAPRDDLLASIPVSDATAVVFADFAELRQTQFAADVLQWAPRPVADADYAQFVRDLGFDYERDLDRGALAVIKHGQETTLFVVADGRFDRKKIAVYALRSGTREIREGREIFSVPLAPNNTRLSFSFLSDSRIVLAESSGFVAYLHRQSGIDAKDWYERFRRLAGSPAFAVIRQDAAAGTALASRAPGGFESPQLSALLNQLQWITLAGKPQGDSLRIVADGECSADQTARQLADLLAGTLVLAQAGLNGPQTREQLSPQSRQAYLEMLRGAEVSRIDRGDTKSVRLVFDVTSNFLQAAKSIPAVEAPPRSPAAKTPPQHPRKRTQKSKSTD